MTITHIALVGAREIVADDCTEIVYQNGIYYMDLTVQIPGYGRGKLQIKKVPVRFTENGYRALQTSVLNAPTGRKKLNS